MLKRTDVVVTLAAIIMLMATSVSANVGQAILTSEKAQDLYLEAVIMARFHDPLMLKIAGCESTGNPNLILHWQPDGSLVKNPTSSASGWAQALLVYHADEIEKMGLDMTNLDDYNTFIDALYQPGGYSAWKESRSCWGKYRHLGVRK